jgi:hypothetical protein
MAILTLFMIAVAPARAGAPAPALVMEPLVCDAGERIEGDSIAYSVAVSNTGNQDVHILGVRVECPCVTAAHPGLIPAGGSDRIDFTIDAKDRRGPLSEHVRIVTDDPESPEVDIELKAKIAPAVSASPSRVSLMGVVGDALQAEVRVKARRADAVDVWVEQVSEPGKFSCTLTPGAVKGEWNLLVVNHAEGPGSYRGRVILRTTSPESPVLIAPVFVRISNEASVAPESLALDVADGPVEPGKKTLGRTPPREGELIVRGERGGLRITGVENPDGFLTASVATIEEGRLFRIMVRPAPEKLREGVTETSLIVRTNASSGGVIRTPVRITRRSGGQGAQ